MSKRRNKKLLMRGVMSQNRVEQLRWALQVP